MSDLQKIELALADFKARLCRRVELDKADAIRFVYKVQTAHQCMLWRVNELAGSAVLSLASNQLVSAAVLIRSLVETAAALYYIGVKVRSIVSSADRKAALSQANTDLSRLLLGRRGHEPDAINVLTMLGHVEKKIPRAREIYDDLSELAHPNWYGAALMYSQGRQEEKVTYTEFAHYMDDGEYARKLCIAAFEMALGVAKIEDETLTQATPHLAKYCAALGSV